MKHQERKSQQDKQESDNGNDEDARNLQAPVDYHEQCVTLLVILAITVTLLIMVAIPNLCSNIHTMYLLNSYNYINHTG